MTKAGERPLDDNRIGTADEPRTPEEYLLGEPTKVALSPAQQERIELRRAMIKSCMAQEEFRDWIWELLTRWSTFGPVFGLSPSGFPQLEGTFFYTGKRQAGWELWKEVDDAASDLSSMMRREHNG